MANAAVTEERLPFVLRDGVPSDLPYVRDSWLIEARNADGYREGQFFTAWQKADMTAIISRPSTRLTVACNEDDPETIQGWCLWADTKPRCLYFVCVRGGARQLGIGRMLLAHLRGEATVLYGAMLPRVKDHEGHRTAHPAARRIPPGWRFVPRINHREVTKQGHDTYGAQV